MMVEAKNVITGKVETIPVVDNTLTKAGYSADAKATGEAIAENNKRIEKNEEMLEELSKGLDDECSERKKEIAVERARIDSFTALSEGSTTGDAELIDARVGADGVTYTNLGEANRTQFSNIRSDMGKLDEELPLLYGLERTANLFNFRTAQNNRSMNTDGSVIERTDNILFLTDFIPVIGGGKLRMNYIAHKVSFYDANKNFISQNTSYLVLYDVPTNAVYTRIQYHKDYLVYENRTKLMVSMEEIGEFESYYTAVPSDSVGNDKLKEASVSFDKLDDEVKELFNHDTNAAFIDPEVKSKTLAISKKKGLLRFAYMTDIHDHPVYRRDYKFSILNKLAKTGMFDFVSCGGDCLGYDTKDEVMKMFQEYNAMVTSGISCPYFLCKGNHDGTGNVYSEADTSNILTKEEWFNIGCRNMGTEVVFDAENPYGGYYYKDFDHAKIRVINLNTSQIDDLEKYFDPMNVIIQQSQIDWFANKALDFSDKGNDKSKWGVVILSHAAINSLELGGLNGQQVIEGILKAFMTGGTYSGSQHDASSVYHVSADVDFTAQGSMEFICAVSSHMHYDSVTTFATLNRPNINIGSAKPDTTAIENGAPNGATRPEPRTSGEISGELADLISIDRENRVINVVRFGAGANKTIDY